MASFDGHEFEQAWSVDDGQGSLARCSPRGHSVRHDLVTQQQFPLMDDSRLDHMPIPEPVTEDGGHQLT